MNRRLQDAVEMRMPSQLRYLALVDAVVQSFAAELDWDQDEVHNIATSAIEAATNAIEHGNRFAADKSVLMRIRSSGDAIEIEVDDEGAGFDPSPFQGDLDAEDVLKLRGRGIFIMRSFMDEVRFTRLPRRGTRVLLRKAGKPVARRSDGRDMAAT